MMKREAFQQAVDAFKHRQPFQPFVVELDDGQQLVVERPEDLRCFAGAATYLPADGSLCFVDSEDVSRLVDLAPTDRA